MRVVFRTVWFTSAVAALSLSLVTFARSRTQHALDAAKMKNPVTASPASIAAGKKLYDAQCASCHGATGKGDGKAGALLKPTPSDLTDADWKHGQTDGEIFTVIRDGCPADRHARLRQPDPGQRHMESGELRPQHRPQDHQVTLSP